MLGRLPILTVSRGRASTNQTFFASESGSKFAQPGMRTRTLDSSPCLPHLVEDVISLDLPSYREREYLTLVFAYTDENVY